MFDYTTHVVMHRKRVQVVEVVTRLSTTLAYGVYGTARDTMVYCSDALILQIQQKHKGIV